MTPHNNDTDLPDTSAGTTGASRLPSSPLPNMKASKVAFYYAVLGSLWILFSDNAADMLFSYSPRTLLIVSTLKGWFFIFVTSLLLYFSTRSHEIQNITTDKHLRECEHRFRSIFEDHSSVMLIVEPISGRIINANHAAAKFYKYNRIDMIGMQIQTINALPPEEANIERQRATSKEQNHFTFPHRLSNGELRTVEVYSYPILIDGSKYLFSIIHDISERKRVESVLETERIQLQAAAAQINRLQPEIQRLSSIDPLTGLWNRRHFREIVQAEVYRAKVHRHPLCLLLIDIDQFKRINDQLGQSAGDSILAQFATSFRSLLRHQDVAACLGGDEFAVLLPETAIAEAILLAENLRLNATAAKLQASSGIEAPPLSLSLGLVSFTDNATDFDSFFRLASEALVEAKKLGGNRMVTKA